MDARNSVLSRKNGKHTCVVIIWGIAQENRRNKAFDLMSSIRHATSG